MTAKKIFKSARQSRFGSNNQKHDRQSQNKTVAVTATAERKVLAHLS